MGKKTSSTNGNENSQSGVKGWFSDIFDNELVKLAAVFLVAGSFIKGCDYIEDIGKNKIDGPLPDVRNPQTKVKIEEQEYILSLPSSTPR